MLIILVELKHWVSDARAIIGQFLSMHARHAFSQNPHKRLSYKGYEALYRFYIGLTHSSPSFFFSLLFSFFNHQNDLTLVMGAFKILLQEVLKHLFLTAFRSVLQCRFMYILLCIYKDTHVQYIFWTYLHLYLHITFTCIYLTKIYKYLINKCCIQC